MKTVQLLIKGKVQGVFFRASTKEVAEQLGIVGTVRNTKEGDVEITASGEEQSIQKFIDWCRRGPSRARVDQLIEQNISTQSFQSFTIIK